eukprot:288389-Chlamydomonas_euryale.AAC.2
MYRRRFADASSRPLLALLGDPWFDGLAGSVGVLVWGAVSICPVGARVISRSTAVNAWVREHRKRATPAVRIFLFRRPQRSAFITSLCPFVRGRLPELSAR